MDNIVHIKQTIICRQLFAGDVVRSRPMKRKKNLQWMIIIFIFMLYVISASPFYCDILNLYNIVIAT